PADFSNSRSELKDKVDPVYPLPLTTKSCKRFSGFIHQATPDDPKHGVRDTLIPWLLFSLSGEKEWRMLRKASKCPAENCGAVLENLPGYYRRGKEGVLGRPELRTAIITRTGINRATGTAREGILFSREVIQKGFFWGEVLLEDDLEEKWSDFLTEDPVGGTVRVGSGRSSGLGKIKIQVEKAVSIDLDSVAQEIKERALSFNDTLKAEAKKNSIKLGHNYYLPLTIGSDLILSNDYFGFRTSLDDEWWQKITGARGKLVYQCARTRRISGWDGIKKLPREDAWGIAAGSVFVFALAEEPDYLQMARMQLAGIGERVGEGYGKIVWADNWHREVKML
ncbi:MAG TPA: hypothetical protein GX711_06170, partial [Clostridia bacterium]|nr:hypothetical protein [Clostridia bacterium]